MSNYTFRYECDVCEQKPVLGDTGMCAVCTFGEADALWEWLDQKWYGRDLREAQSYLKNMQRELAQAGMSFSPEIAPRILHILSLKHAGRVRK